MLIDDDGFSARSNRLEGAPNTREDSSPDMDVAFFRSMLEHSTLATASPAKEGMSTMLAEVSALLKTKESRLGQLLKTSSNGIEMGKFNEYPRELSNVVLTSQMLIKSLGKTVQCIDKICNLQ